MTDIVERLRWCALHGRRKNSFEAINMLREAADEIERLRALALKFLDEQTEANADALRAACEVRQ